MLTLRAEQVSGHLARTWSNDLRSKDDRVLSILASQLEESLREIVASAQSPPPTAQLTYAYHFLSCHGLALVHKRPYPRMLNEQNNHGDANLQISTVLR